MGSPDECNHAESPEPVKLCASTAEALLHIHCVSKTLTAVGSGDVRALEIGVGKTVGRNVYLNATLSSLAEGVEQLIGSTVMNKHHREEGDTFLCLADLLGRIFDVLLRQDEFRCRLHNYAHYIL